MKVNHGNAYKTQRFPIFVGGETIKSKRFCIKRENGKEFLKGKRDRFVDIYKSPYFWTRIVTK